MDHRLKSKIMARRMDFGRRFALNNLVRSLKCKPTLNARQLILNLILQLISGFRRRSAIPVGNQPPGWSILVERSCRAVRRSPVAQRRTQPSSTSAPCSNPSTNCSMSPYRAFLDRHVAPYHDQWEKDKIVDRGVWLEAGKQGFLGMAVPEEYGGVANP